MFDVCVMTCRRDGVNYLPETQRQLAREGFEEVFIACDGPRPEKWMGNGRWLWPLSDPDFPEEEPRLGHSRSMRRVLNWARLNQMGVLLVEDDVELAAGAGGIIRRLIDRFNFHGGRPEYAAWLAFCDFKETAKLPVRLEAGVRIMAVPPNGLDSRGWWGTQCTYFPLRTLDWLGVADWNSTPLGGYHGGGDVKCGMLAAARGLGWAVTIPQVVQHVGAVSAVHAQTLESRLAPHYVQDASML